MSNRDSITQDFLHKLFDYKDGHLFWKIQTHKTLVGGRAGHSKKDGYRVVTINRINHFEHRLIYTWHRGGFNSNIDHIDGNPSNNNIENLRLATPLQNSRNRKTSKNNTSGKKGVSFDKKANKWRVYIGLQGKVKILGFFENFDDAATCRENAEKEIFKEFNRVS
jgi:hypothetical protein